MKCPYCKKIVSDMPNHLGRKRETCGVAHAKKLLRDLDTVICAAKKKKN